MTTITESNVRCMNVITTEQKKLKKLPNNLGFVVLSDQQNAGLNIIYSKECQLKVYTEDGINLRKEDLFNFRNTFLLHSPRAQTWTEPLQGALQGLSGAGFLPRCFDYGTYLPTAERKEQIPHRWVPLPVCVRACACVFACQCTAQGVFVSLYLFYLSWHANPSVKVWAVSSGVWLWDLSGGNIQVWDPSLSVGLTSDGKDLAHRLLTKPQLWMIQELSKSVSRRGQPLAISDMLYFSFHRSEHSVNITPYAAASARHQRSVYRHCMLLVQLLFKVRLTAKWSCSNNYWYSYLQIMR